MNLLSDEILLDTYICACEVNCDKDFLEILVHQIQLRGLTTPNVENIINGIMSYT